MKPVVPQPPICHRPQVVPQPLAVTQATHSAVPTEAARRAQGYEGDRAVFDILALAKAAHRRLTLP